MRSTHTLVGLIQSAVFAVGTLACSSGSSGSAPTQPAVAGQSRIASLDRIEPNGPATLVSMPEASAQQVLLTFTVQCDPPSPGEPCHIGFDFLDADGRWIARGPGSGDFVDAGLHVVRAGGAPKGFTGTTIGVRAALNVGTSNVELAAGQYRGDELTFTWVSQ